MNYKLKPSECQSAFEELYRSSPVPIAVRSACNSSISSINKSVFKSPQPLVHTQLISPRPLVTSTSGPRLDPKSQLFESLKNTSDGKSKSDLVLNDNTERQLHDKTMTDGGEGDVTDDPQGKYGKGKHSTHIQPDTSTADVRLDQGDVAAKASTQEEEEDEDDHFINNFFSKKAPKDIDSVSQTEDQDGEETCQDADVEDGSEASSQEDEMFSRGKRQTRGSSGDAAPIKLYEWIVKPIEKSTKTRGICLDGRKDKSIDEYWQTGMVTMRHSATIVATASGSRYHLIGPMDLYEAVESGMTPEVAKKFKRGFPVNWVHVLEEYFASLDQDDGSTLEETQYNQQGQGRELTRLRSTSGKRQHDQFYLDSADSETDVSPLLQQKEEEKPPRRNARSCDARNKYANQKSESNSNSQREDYSSEDIFRSSNNYETLKGTNLKDLKKKQTQGGLSSSQEELSAGDNSVKERTQSVTKLHLWIIKPMHGKSLGICLEGQRDREEEYWHSSVISDRLDQKRVITNSGSVYQLVGPIQKLDALEAGIPEKIVKAFQNGFPKNWKTLLKKYYNPSAESASESEASVATTASSVQTRKQKAKKPRTSLRKRKPKPEKHEVIDLNNSVCTPHGQLVDLDHIPKTRSGRQIMPQLAWWVGQRRSYDAHGNVKEITYGTPHAESYVKQSYTDIKSRTFSSRKYTPANTSTISSRKKTSNVESEVLSVIETQKQDRLSQQQKGRKETCYNQKNKTDRRKSKLDMLPVVPLTVMKAKHANSLSESSDVEDRSESKKDKVKPKRQASSKRRILDVESSSSEDEKLSSREVEQVSSSNKKSNVKSKRQPAKTKKVQPSKKRKSTESSSESEINAKKPRRIRKIEDSGDDMSPSSTELPEPNQKTLKNDQTKPEKAQPKAEKCDWGKSEVKRLYKAVEKTSEHHPHFWDVVAESVETRSPDECRIFHENSSNHVETQKKAKKSKPKGKSKKGKSKKDVVEEDDFFQATPFRPSNNNKSKTFNLTAEETMVFEDECLPTPGAQHKTPIVKDIQSLRLEKSLFYKSRLEKPSTASAEETETQSKPADQKKKSKAKADKNGIEGLTAGKGTLKRKEQLRDIYNKHNEGEEDDIFTATPNRDSKHKKKVPSMFTLTEEEELEFESGCIPTPGSRHKTPIVRDSQSSRYNKIPNSSAKTVTTPWLSNLDRCRKKSKERKKVFIRKTTDQVIAQNQRQGGKQKIKDSKGSRTPRARGAVKKSGPTKSLFRNETTLTNLFEEVEDAVEDDEEEKDYYWSDEDS